MNGVPIGMALIIIVNRDQRTREDRSLDWNGCCGVGLGSSMLASCG